MPQTTDKTLSVTTRYPARVIRKQEPAMITLSDAPDPRLETVLEDGLATYNAKVVGRRDWRPLAVTVNDPDTGELAGGLLGRTSLGLMFVDLVYLPEDLRGNGTGSAMLRMAEVEAIRRGCLAGTLVTVNFQAPGFYARHGWEEFGRIASAPGVVRIFMRKLFGQCYPATTGGNAVQYETV
jgi:GNAT superfamily N-acetyltransferase